MPPLPDRTFSFDQNDEISLNSNGQGQVNRFFPPPRDAPSRDMQVSPPSNYRSPPPREYNVSPPSPPLHRNLLPQRTDSSFPQYPISQPYGYNRVLPSQIQTSGYNGRSLDHQLSNRTASTTTPGADNLGPAAAGGGLAGIALGVANTNERDSGVEALQFVQDAKQEGRGVPNERNFDTVGSDTPYIPEPPRMTQHRDSYSSTVPLGAAAASPGQMTSQHYDSTTSIPLDVYPSHDTYGGRSGYSDNPYNRFPSTWDPRVERGDIDPNAIEDDGDDGMTANPPKRRSILGIPEAGGAVAGSAAAGGILGGWAGLLTGRKATSRNTSGQYGQVDGNGNGFSSDNTVEKSEWLSRQTTGRRKLRWAVGILLVLCIVGAIVAGVVRGVKGAQGNKSSAGQTAAEDDGHGDLDKNSPEIQKLLGNKDLHKVFPGMDYTPLNAQYPDCLSNMPSQNNVTRDMAVLSQLTKAVRLYGTDCNQTEMVLHAINKLGLTDTKVWLGVWLGNNDTTNNRQLGAMYDILDKNGADPFAGVIVGNEVLYRKDLTEMELGTVLSSVKSNLTSKKIDLPLATSDLGDSWTAGLAAEVDVVMSNVHPFFAGVPPDSASAWLWNFWQTHDVILTQGTTKKNVIAETGWPSDGGKDCGQATSCTGTTPGSVAGIDGINTFMGDFVCQSLANKTEYFWSVVSVKISHGVTSLADVWTTGLRRLTNLGRCNTTSPGKRGRTNGA